MQLGFFVCSILLMSGFNFNDGQVECDVEIQQCDCKWKSFMLCWGILVDGEWYWKVDISLDEFDGYYFFYGVYYDLVVIDEEKVEVCEVVYCIIDYLFCNDYLFVDYDGEYMCWVVFGLQVFNNDLFWWEECGFNLMSVFFYLWVVEYVSVMFEEVEFYVVVVCDLILNYGYVVSVCYLKVQQGLGIGNQFDDEMVLMNFYNLLCYESDVEFCVQWVYMMECYWMFMSVECNLFFYFFFVGVFDGQEICYIDVYDDYVVWVDCEVICSDVFEMLVCYLFDCCDWLFVNSYWYDVELLWFFSDECLRGYCIDGKVLFIDECFVGYWNYDLWLLDFGGCGMCIVDGVSYLLFYYFGWYYCFIEQFMSLERWWCY